MNNNILNGKKHIHFIGIGGSGMYPLAQILHSQGYFITGSDNNETETLKAVREMGIPVFIGQRAENIEGADLIIHTSAIMNDNPELIASKASGVPVLERAELLGIITEWYSNAVCVSGTHGKTTSTSMITQILYTAGIDLSAYIGGKLPCINGSGRAGKSDILVCESCEFQDHFLKLSPDISVILNIDADHLDYFGTLENIIKSFRKFAENTSKTLIINGDDQNTLKAVEGIEGKKIITFGLSEKNNYFPKNIEHVSGTENHFDVFKNGEYLCSVKLHVAGNHNILNALSAIAVADELGIDVNFCIKGLNDFTGAKRRFEKLGYERGITIVDDYAHHPAELEATLTSAMQMGYRKVWAVFQPFTFSRTKILLNDFARVLKIPDYVILTDIMGSREKNTYGITSRHIAEKLPNCVWFPEDEPEELTDEKKYFTFQNICCYVCENAQPNDLIITLGCGDAYKIADMIIKKLRKKQHTKSKSKETAVYNYIRNSLAKGTSPSVREIMQALGFKSTSTAHRYIESLVNKGLIEKQNNLNRTLKLPNNSSVPVVMLKSINSNPPCVDADNISGYINFEASGADPDELFAFTVKDSNMAGAGILKGDTAIVNTGAFSESGDIVAVLTDSDKVEVKRLSADGEKYILSSENGSGDIKETDRSDILGRIIGIKRCY